MGTAKSSCSIRKQVPLRHDPPPHGLGEVRHTIAKHSGPITHLSFLREGTRLATLARDGTARLWDPITSKHILTIDGLPERLLCASLNAQGSLLVIGARNGSSLWSCQTGKKLLHFSSYDGPIPCMAVTPDGRRAVGGCDDSNVRVWDVESGALLSAFQLHTGAVRSVAVTPDGSAATSGGTDGLIGVYDTRNSSTLQKIDAAKGFVNSVRFLPSVSGPLKILAAGADKSVRVWEGRTGACALAIDAEGPVVDACASFDARLMGAVVATGGAYLWDVMRVF
jgi:WD40 repeat protein